MDLLISLWVQQILNNNGWGVLGECYMHYLLNINCEKQEKFFVYSLKYAAVMTVLLNSSSIVE